MEGYCRHCGHQIDDTSPEAIGKLISAHTSLYYWEDYEVGKEVFVPGLGTVKVVHNSYLSLDDDGSMKLVFETAYGLVAVTGYYSSYNGSVWNDDFQKAEKKTKEVVYFE